MSEVQRKIPKAVWEGAFVLCGVTLRCYVLDDGRRLINSDDMAAWLEAMEVGAEPDPKEVEAFARWQKGLS